jgi:hypothetical protein
MTEPRQIAIVHDYREFMDALRARADELGVEVVAVGERGEDGG